jgi:hypothetical protein
MQLQVKYQFHTIMICKFIIMDSELKNSVHCSRRTPFLVSQAQAGVLHPVACDIWHLMAHDVWPGVNLEVWSLWQATPFFSCLDDSLLAVKRLSSVQLVLKFKEHSP